MSSQQDELKETDTEARFEFRRRRNPPSRPKGLTEETVRVISEDKDEPGGCWSGACARSSSSRRCRCRPTGPDSRT